MLVNYLCDSGYSAHGVSDGKFVLPTLNASDYDLIILDLIMPEKEGIETIMALRNAESAIPIIAISGGGRTRPEANLNIAQMLGARYAFAKPVPLSTLLDAVKTCLHSNNSDQTAT